MFYLVIVDEQSLFRLNVLLMSLILTIFGFLVDFVWPQSFINILILVLSILLGSIEWLISFKLVPRSIEIGDSWFLD